MDGKILTYEEFLSMQTKKYPVTQKCRIPGCDKPGYYEGGDARCWFPMCEEHVCMVKKYITYLNGCLSRIRIRRIWCKDDPTLPELEDRVVDMLEEIGDDQT